MHRFKEFHIRDQMMSGIRLYIDEGELPGNFLRAVICNDLRMAVGYADEGNLRNIPAFVDYFYNVAPKDCWGSEERMLAWIKYKNSERAAKEAG